MIITKKNDYYNYLFANKIIITDPLPAPKEGRTRENKQKSRASFTVYSVSVSGPVSGFVGT